MDLTLDRTVEYKGTIYKIVETLNSDMLLVITIEDYEKGIFPIPTYIVPGQ